MRKFVCKRCGKKATDKQGDFSHYSQKHETTLFYENIDLCDKCFKKTTKEERSVKMLEGLVEQNILSRDDIEGLKRFQKDPQFKRECLIKGGFIKTKGSTNPKRSPSYYRRLALRKEKRLENE
jgi:hypothetical protein